jgi:hypothetical protein
MQFTFLRASSIRSASVFAGLWAAMQLKGLRSDPVIPGSFSHSGPSIQLQHWDSFEWYLRSVWIEESSLS